jgi:eukaryotic-like serine/threonine-protein kinase
MRCNLAPARMGNLYRFTDFVLDPGARTLTRAGLPVSLTPRAFDVLLFLAQNPNRLVTKEELLQSVWGDTFVEEGNLTQYISHLRKALGDSAEDGRLIATIARKGYQFTAPVTVKAESPEIPLEQLPSPLATTVEQATPRSVVVSPRAPRRWFALAASLFLVFAVLWLYWIVRHRVVLAPSDTIVLASLQNDTSDPVFDDALDSALRVALEQTPYLNTLGMDKVQGTLAQLNLPPATKFTPDIARQVCLRTNSKLVIAQSIGDAGNGYHLRLRALDCATGKILAQEQIDIAKREEVVHELGVASARLRRKLGESAASVAGFNPPLEQASSASPEALQAATQGNKLFLASDAPGGIKLLQRAVELDPNLAAAYGRLGAAYLFTQQLEASADAYTRAYQLRDRLTAKDRAVAEMNYYSNVPGDWEKEYSSALGFVDTFPRDLVAHSNLRAAYIHLGQPDKAADEAAKIARLRPSAYYFGSAIQSIRYANRFNDAKSWIANADALKYDTLLIRRERLIVAFATGDRDTVEKILSEEEKGKYRKDFLHEHSLIEIQRGRFRSASLLRQQAAEHDTKEQNADWWVFLSALENAEVGKDAPANRGYQGPATEAKLDRNGALVVALTLARSGQIEEAGKLADQISPEAPDDTLVQHYFLPTIRAAIKLRQNDPAAAIAMLRDTEKYDLAFTGLWDYLYPAYIRGLAYLQLGDGKSAAAQFQKLIDYRGFTVRHVIGPLAWFQLARAQKLAGDQSAAKKSYETFLNLWADADPDVLINQQAKAEYANLPK